MSSKAADYQPSKGLAVLDAIARNEKSTVPEMIARVLAVIAFVLVFIPDVNPARIFIGREKYSEEKKAYLSEEGKMNINLSLFTSAVDYEATVKHLKNDYNKEQIKLKDKNGKTMKDEDGKVIKIALLEEKPFRTLQLGAILTLAGVLIYAVAQAASIGNRKMRSAAYPASVFGAVCSLAGIYFINSAYHAIEDRLRYIADLGYESEIEVFNQVFPAGIWIFAIIGVIALALGVVNTLTNLSRIREAGKLAPVRYAMQEKYRLFLMLLPVLILTFLFAYLPIYGWRYAFYELVPGDYTLTGNKFVGLYQFRYLFMNSADTVRVLKNTIIMSGLGIATSWLPIAFAILLAEIPSKKFQRFVQSFTTIPNFISWVLVYAVALAIFSRDGFLNQLIGLLTGNRPDTIYLQDGSNTWIKMLLWGTWKGLGWSAIIYIAGISGIDQQLYEAAKVDGANRWQCIRHVTIPGLLPTYMVMLLLSIAGILSNGMEQYLVFSNAWNKETIEVLDLYVYNIGMGSSANLPLATVIGVTKSFIGIALLLVANRVSKAIRGESII